MVTPGRMVAAVGRAGNGSGKLANPGGRDYLPRTMNSGGSLPMRRSVPAAIALLALALARPALPHHSVANFDFTKSATVTGTVTYFSFTNPHSFIDMKVKDSKGVEHDYKFFTVARVVMMRTGWALDDLKPGDKVTVTGSPDRKTPEFMYLSKIVFAGGKVWNHDPALQR
jgi:hypothetical protein